MPIPHCHRGWEIEFLASIFGKHGSLMWDFPQTQDEHIQRVYAKVATEHNGNLLCRSFQVFFKRTQEQGMMTTALISYMSPLVPSIVYCPL